MFTFPEGFVVPAGQYRLAAYTNVERTCSMGFCYGEDIDTYDGGARSLSGNGIDGPWSEDSEGNDIPFRLHLDEGSVDSQKESWGSIKGMYRDATK